MTQPGGALRRVGCMRPILSKLRRHAVPLALLAASGAFVAAGLTVASGGDDASPSTLPALPTAGTAARATSSR